MKTIEEIRELLFKVRAEQRMCIYHDAVWHAFQTQIITLEWVLK